MMKIAWKCNDSTYRCDYETLNHAEESVMIPCEIELTFGEDEDTHTIGYDLSRIPEGWDCCGEDLIFILSRLLAVTKSENYIYDLGFWGMDRVVVFFKKTEDGIYIWDTRDTVSNVVWKGFVTCQEYEAATYEAIQQLESVLFSKKSNYLENRVVQDLLHLRNTPVMALSEYPKCWDLYPQFKI